MIQVLHGDCRDRMAELAECSVDAIVSDPPYGLVQGKKGGTGVASINLDSPYGRARIGTGHGPGGFMGCAWDSAVPGPEFWAAALRVAKPGAYLVAFGGTRTSHRLACAIEDAGWELRDTLGWLYGSGFPKSLDFAGERDEATKQRRTKPEFSGHWAADGWGTALKPAWEPITLARKPLIGTVAANVLAHGTGALNIDGCRIEAADDAYARNCSGDRGHGGTRDIVDRGATDLRPGGGAASDLGRWPANILHDGSDEVLAMFPAEAGAAAPVHRRNGEKFRQAYGTFAGNIDEAGSTFHGDSGSAARFFWSPKASTAERNLGLGQNDQNRHPTVKPVDLMAYLCRLALHRQGRRRFLELPEPPQGGHPPDPGQAAVGAGGMTTPPRRPLVRYHGGKWRLAPWIIGHFPKHRIYVEPYGGGGSVLLRKPRSYGEIYNDLDGEIVNLFRVTRDQGAELLRRIELTPFARGEFAVSYEPSADPIEQARLTLVRSFMGFGSAGICKETTGFRANSNRSGTTPAQDWRNYPAALALVIDRLRGVVIENRDALEVMAIHDSPDTLHYVDPPYVHATRSGKVRGTVTSKAYKHEMTDDDHGRMAAALGQLKGTVVLSGYRNGVYDDLFQDWQRIDQATHADGARARVESLWLSPNSHQVGLFRQGWREHPDHGPGLAPADAASQPGGLWGGEVSGKADYVRAQPQTRDHGCHWPGCDKQVPPAMWGCKQHWFQLPPMLRARIWATYRPGQEVTMTPSAEYVEVAKRVHEWIIRYKEPPQ